jgi:hypothetical protein
MWFDFEQQAKSMELNWIIHKIYELIVSAEKFVSNLSWISILNQFLLSSNAVIDTSNPSI